jgi:hypothetical protein
MQGHGIRCSRRVDAAPADGAERTSSTIAVLVLSLLLLTPAPVEAQEHVKAGNVPAHSSVTDQPPVELASYAVVDRVPRPPGTARDSTAPGPAAIRFDQDMPDTLLRVLMSRSPHDPAWYPSPFQTGPSRVLVSGRVVDGSPADTFRAVYVRVVEQGHAWDGSPDVTDNNGTVELRSMGDSAAWRVRDGVYRLTTDAEGRFRAEGRFTADAGGAPASGDGFFVEASHDASFSCGQDCPRTGLFRLWKRIYVESDAMYRSGASIAREAHAGSTRVEVDDVRPFRDAKPGRPLEVLLMHAPWVDAVPPDALADEIGHRHEEKNLVVGVARPDRSSWRGAVLLAHPTRRWFGPEPGDADLSDAIVVPGRGVFPPPSLRATRETFRNAFVEIVELPNPSPHVPHKVFDVSRRGRDFDLFAQKWSDYGPAVAAGTHNTVMVVAADHKTLLQPDGRRGMSPAIGSCYKPPSYVASVFLWLGAVEWQVRSFTRGVGIGGAKASAVAEELAVHELAHAFGVDDAEGTGERLNTDGTGLSSMTHPVGPEMADGVAGFHASEYRVIRRHLDPLAQ